MRLSFLLAFLVTTTISIAQTATSGESLPDTTTVAADTAASDTLSTKPLKSVRTAMLLSLFLPGGGQFYNESYWKAGVIAAAEIGFAAFAARQELLLLNLDTAWTRAYPDSAREYAYRRNALFFLTGVVIAYSVADAYVDANMFHFRESQRLTLEPATNGLGLALRYRF